MWQRFANQSIRFNGLWQTWNFLQLVFRSCWKNSASSLRVTRTPHKYIYIIHYINYIFIPEKNPNPWVMQAVLLEAVQGRHAALAEELVLLLSFGCGQSKAAGDDLEDHTDIEFIWAGEGSYHLKYSQIYNRKIVQMIRIDIDMSYVLLVFFLVCVFFGGNLYYPLAKPQWPLCSRTPKSKQRMEKMC